jgi:hypothetical protein
MAFDLLFGPRKRWWAREPDKLLEAPAVTTHEKPGERALREARELDSRVKVRPAAGRGAVVSARVKWG